MVRKGHFVGFPKQKNCNLCGRKYAAFSPSAMYCKKCRKINEQRIRREYGKRRRMGLGIVSKLLTKIPWICYWCMAVCKPGTLCGDCGTLYDEAKAKEAFGRQSKNYINIIAENAKKSGKNVKEAVRKAQLANARRDLECKEDWRGVNKKLEAFLKRKI